MTLALSREQIEALLQQMAADIRARLGDRRPLLIGIHTGGVWIARALQERLGQDFFDAPPGTLNIAYYRDDFTRIGMHPQVTPSDLPFSVDGRHLLLVDDVLHSGRTTRAALNEIFDYGRPASVSLAVLVDRNGRELPIQADIVGTTMTLEPGQHVKLTHSDGLQLEFRGRDVGDDQ